MGRMRVEILCSLVLIASITTLRFECFESPPICAARCISRPHRSLQLDVLKEIITEEGNVFACPQAPFGASLGALSAVLKASFDGSGSKADAPNVVLATALITTSLHSSGALTSRDDTVQASVQAILQNAVSQLQVSFPFLTAPDTVSLHHGGMHMNQLPRKPASEAFKMRYKIWWPWILQTHAY